MSNRQAKTMIIDGNIIRPARAAAEPIPNPWDPERQSYGSATREPLFRTIDQQDDNGRFRFTASFPTPPSKQSPSLILSAVQICLFLLTWIVSLFDSQESSLFGVSFCTLYKFGGTWAPGIKYRFEVYRLILPIFLHASFLHLLINMISQWSLIFTFENDTICGWKRLLAFYLLCGIGGNALSCLFSPLTLSVGASGSLFALLGLHGCYILSRWAEFSEAQRRLMLMNFLLILFLNALVTVSSSSINVYAHAGGFMLGAASAAAVLRPPEGIDHFGIHRFAKPCLAASLAILVLAIALIWLRSMPDPRLCQ